MKTFNLLFFLSYILEILSDSNVFDSFLGLNNNMDELMQKLNLSNNLNIILDVINNNETNNKCLANIKHHYHNNMTEIDKLYAGSSRSFIDMNSFITCINDKTNTFFSIYPYWNKEARMDIVKLDEDKLKEHEWIFGICLKNNMCTTKEIAEIFDKVNILFGKPFKLYTKDNISVDDFYKVKNEKSNVVIAILSLIPFYLVSIQVIFMIFKIIPVKIFSCCFRRKYLRDSDKNLDQSIRNRLLNNASLTRQISLKIQKCFSISEIFDDLILSKKNELFKDEDMTYLKGIKTLGIFLFIYGFSFTVLYNYPLCISEVEKRKEYMTEWTTSLLIISFRISPALILSSSAYSLSYKFLSFLDKKLMNIDLDNSEQKLNHSKEANNNNHETKEDKEKDKENNLNKIAEKTETNKGNSKSLESSSDVSQSYYENTFGIKFYSEDVSKAALNNIFKGQKINENLLLSEIPTKRIPYSMYFNFIFRQTHKFACIGFGVVLFKMSFPMLLVLIGRGPLIYYIFKTYFERLGTAVTNYLFIGNFADLFSDTDSFLMMQLFCIPMSEFNYFMIGSVLIFICYKKKWRLDIIILVLIGLNLVFKFWYVLADIENRNPGMFYSDSDYQRFFFNPIFNFDFYLIGMLFGMINYVVQNGLINKQSLINERPFVKIPIYLSKLADYQRNQKGLRKKNNIHFLIIILLIIFSLIITPIYFSNDFDKLIRKNNPNIFFIIFSLIDIELFTYCFHFFCIACYVSGQNSFFELLNANISSYGLKLGYWIVFATPTFTYLIVYINEANINLSFFIVLVYGCVTLINSTLIAIINFVLVEMPYKKMIKLYFNISSELNKVYLEDESEENAPISDGDLRLSDLNEKDLLKEIGENNLIKEDDNEEEFKD